MIIGLELDGRSGKEKDSSVAVSDGKDGVMVIGDYAGCIRLSFPSTFSHE